MVQTTLKIDGMMCGMCEAHINDCIRQNFNVKKVTSSFKKGESVILSEGVLDTDKLKSVIGDTGYTVISFTIGEPEKKGLFGFLKK